MYEHWNVKISGRKGPGNVLEVHLDLIGAGCIVGGVGVDLDYPSVFGEKEVVGSFLLIKAHTLVPALLHGLLVVSMRACVLRGKGKNCY